MIRLVDEYSLSGYEKEKADICLLYGLYLEGSGQFQDAIESHTEALDLYRELSKEDPKYLDKVDECAERLCRLYEINGNPEKAERIRGLKEAAHARNE
jgi:hypothetical protein